MPRKENEKEHMGMLVFEVSIHPWGFTKPWQPLNFRMSKRFGNLHPLISLIQTKKSAL